VTQTRWQTELKAGFESTVHGFSSTIAPLLIFVSFFGSQAGAGAYWITLVSATLVPAFSLFLKGNSAIHLSTRTASLTAYAALILQLSLASVDIAGQSLLPTPAQLLTGLAAGSLLFALASGLILLAGLFRLGHIFKMIPSTVTAGISNSTAALLLLMALQQLLGSPWQGSLVALAMGLIFLLWTLLQQHVQRLHPVPNILMALLAGLVLHALLNANTAQHGTDMGLDWSWLGLHLWAGLLEQPHLGHLLLVGLPGTLTLALIMILESFTAGAVMTSRFGLRVNADQELVALGGSNLFSALLGGAPVTGNSLRSVVSWTAGGRDARSALMGMSLAAMVLLLLGPWLLLIPAGIVAGLFVIQTPMMVDASFKQRMLEMLRTRQLRRQDGAADLGFWITFVITLAGIFGNLIWACFLGIGLSCLAVLRRVSGSLTSHWTYLDQFRSCRVRSLSEITLLEQRLHHVGVLQLTGHLFFGNSTRLTQLFDEVHIDARVVVIDVSRVHDVDPSGMAALLWLIRALQERQFKVILSGALHTASAELQRVLATQSELEFSIDLDRGIELGEEFVLQQSDVAPVKLQSIRVNNNLLLKDLDADDLTAVLLLLEYRELPSGADLFHRLDEADGVWLLEEGMVSILSGHADATRLATFGPGQFVGEMGFIDGQPRSATARADTALRALFLDNQSLVTLTQRHPGAALKISLNIARELSLRMRNSSKRIGSTPPNGSPDWLIEPTR
jgi:SulP family sulfate permease